MIINNDLSIKHIIREPLYNNNNPPIFLIIHGYGADEKDLFYLFKNISYNFFIISLRAIYTLNFGGYSWYDIYSSNNFFSINFTQANESRKRIIDFIYEAINFYNLNINNIWICGFSQGGILSYAISLHHSDIIKKVIILSACPYIELFPKNKKDTMKNLNFFISHGKNDNIIPIILARKIHSILDYYNIKNFLYKEYNSGHSLNELIFQDLIKWIEKEL